jgi:predicted DNA-binding mobile mystery protein A
MSAASPASQQGRRALDRRLAGWRAVTIDSAVPAAGWVRAIRDALGMSAADLAARMGVSSVAVSKLESSERRGSVRLDTLRRAAEAMDCELVYALVPRDSLEAAVHAQAERVVARELPAIANSMRLEGQGLDDDRMRETFEVAVEEVLGQRGLWRA